MAAAPGHIPGIDIARALAIAGMMAVHIGPTHYYGLAGVLYALPHGRASVLFVLLAGIGVSLLAQAPKGAGRGGEIRLAWRALWLLPVGLLLQLLDHNVNVILHHYAVLFVVALLIVHWPARRLLIMATMMLVIGPLAVLAGQIHEPVLFNRAATTLLDPPALLLHKLTLSGPYPLVVWVVPLLFGLWLGRLDLNSAVVQNNLILRGAMICFFTFAARVALEIFLLTPTGPKDWNHLLATTPHSQMPLWLLDATGAATLVLGLCLKLGTRWPRLTWPLAAMGQLAFSIYVLHLLTLHFWSPTLRSSRIGEATLLLTMTVGVAVVFAVVWRRFQPRGPLEMVLQPPAALLVAGSRGQRLDGADRL